MTQPDGDQRRQYETGFNDGVMALIVVFFIAAVIGHVAGIALGALGIGQ